MVKFLTFLQTIFPETTLHCRSRNFCPQAGYLISELVPHPPLLLEPHLCLPPTLLPLNPLSQSLYLP
ncbi:hypothetical protein FOMPIDRAFT_88598 [Fomitopsis schrenkii]|uniref:Uncharacterized protein n=1 Tax=Fomitopsis schrenkii TaxID=2126942 RepID=S8E3K3_FOMSC|nr:hypothetical protein FOMPIDRAFT_88598 [Fomitopsis schrenkii]